MADSAPDLVDRLAALPSLSPLPRKELAWLAAHGQLEKHAPGTVFAAKGQRIRKLWIMFSGKMAVHVDRGAGLKRVIEWSAGDVSGMLPYSRMKGPPGNNVIERPTELLAIDEDHFTEMVCECPEFTTLTVHSMVDRARSFNSSDLQDEKMISLGKLAAGLAHELNNPASAVGRDAQVLGSTLERMGAAARALGAAGLSEAHLRTIEDLRAACVDGSAAGVLTPIEQADREDAITDWLDRHEADQACATPLAETAVTIDTLDALAAAVPEGALGIVLRWLAAECATHALARDIEQAARRISELVASIKAFTYMDNLAGPARVSVEKGLQDTIRVLTAKAREKGAGITLDVEPGLPPVQAAGGDLNQVWMNLIDNALDAVGKAGHIDITVRRELRRVVVKVADDGPGIPDDVLPRIFDPFFTTKPPGQGTGLGLEIARQLLRRHKGDITVQSRPGRTEFTITLAAASADDGAAVASEGPS